MSLGNDAYQKALDYIYSFVDYESQPRPRDAAHYDLRRMDELLERIGNPHLNVRTVHIAGTKGKGSVAAMVASVLASAGYRTGLYTSPHLHTFNERIRVNSELISDDEVVALVEMLKPEVAAVNERSAYGKLTTFEVITALGFAHFRREKVDIQVVEVGLGGRLDATNVVKPEVCVITSLSLDHTEVLGDTLAKIAGEKAGIIKPGSTVISSPQAREAGEVIERACRAAGVPLIRAGKEITWLPPEKSADGQSFRVKGITGEYSLTIPLLGEHQLENASVAVAALEILNRNGLKISGSDIVRGMRNVNWPGRLQVLGRSPLVVVDGAHNPYSAGRLREALKQYFTFEKGILIMGSSADKDVSGMVSELAPLFHTVIITRSTHPRAMASEALAARFRQYGTEIKITEDISTALPAALEIAGEKDLICVTGSLFVVAGAIEQAEKLGLAV
jgi:dihydrofolate synthase/folylpolyglutamate synthase